MSQQTEDLGGGGAGKQTQEAAVMSVVHDANFFYKYIKNIKFSLCFYEPYISERR